MTYTRYTICRSHRDVKKLVKACTQTEFCSFDFETNAEKIYNASFKPTLLSISFQAGSGIAIPLDHFETPTYCKPGYNWKKELKYFGRRVLENPKITKCAWNLKFDDQIAKKYHIYAQGTLIDGMLTKYLLNEERPNGLKDMVRRYIPDASDYEKAEKFENIPWDKKELKPLSKYGCQDADYTLRLTLFMERKLIDCGLYGLLRNILMPATRVLGDAERSGLLLDRKLNNELVSSYQEKIEIALKKVESLRSIQQFQKKLNESRIEKYLDKIYDELDKLDPSNPKDKKKIQNREKKISNIQAHVFTSKKEKELIAPFKVSSKNQLSLLLYTDMGYNFEVIEYTKDKKGRETDTPSCSGETITKLNLSVHNRESQKAKFLEAYLEWNDIAHIWKTFMWGWQRDVQDDNALHGKFNIIGTTSGRLSSSEPNLQQIPKTTVNEDVKRQLIAPPGMLYVAYDYSQAELRIMAYLSGDETYIKAFNEGKDPHLAIACQQYHEDYDKIIKIYKDEQHPEYKTWKIRRKLAKHIVFGVIYGIQAKKLSEQMSSPKDNLFYSKEDAQGMLDDFFEQHPKIKLWMAKQRKFVHKNGFVKSLFGRKRRCPEVFGDNSAEIAYAERQSYNMPCQSAASDMALFASILIYWNMKQGKFPFMKEVATVHDAVYHYAIPENINIWTIYEIWDICRNPKTKKYFGFSIDTLDMSMDFSIGRTMAEELPFIPNYDYRKMLEPDFNVDEYWAEYKKYKDIDIADYPKKFHKEIEGYKERFKRNRLCS